MGGHFNPLQVDQRTLPPPPHLHHRPPHHNHLKHLQHQPNQSKSNLSRQAPLSQQEADEKVISQQANQTLWLFHNRQDQTLWLFFVAVPLVIPQCIQSQSCTEDGNENPVLHTIPQQPQTSTLSSGSVA